MQTPPSPAGSYSDDVRTSPSSMILQPDNTPPSPDQLEGEVEKIYADLVTVETKCITVDAALTAHPQFLLDCARWTRLMGLHRTLLYDHYDFLMVTQHPSATPTLSELAVTHSMPARMWKHGIHALLEVLRHRRPDSQDYILSFIYLAYQMMGLLLETVHCFTDTWIECLGDLARYSMAIEEENEAHAAWAGTFLRPSCTATCLTMSLGTAVGWYTLASDHHPATGRLYHHLGILERSSLRKLCLFGKSLTCIIPFEDARHSFSAMCGDIVQNRRSILSSSQSVEDHFVTVYALIYSGSDGIDAVKSHALDMLHGQIAELYDFGAYLAVTNTCALFGFGATNSRLLQYYRTAIELALQDSRPSQPTANPFIPLSQDVSTTYEAGSSFAYYKSLWVDSVSVVLQNYKPTPLGPSMAYIHIMLVALHSLHSLRTKITNGYSNHPFRSPLDTNILPWGLLADYLNALTEQNPIDARVLHCARQGRFLAPKNKDSARPLPEDFILRGLIWTQFLFSPGWFSKISEHDGRTIETQSTREARADRVLWLGLYMVFHAGYLEYNRSTKKFAVLDQ